MGTPGHCSGTVVDSEPRYFLITATCVCVQRIDYGTGHENTFICFLCCMRRLRVFGDADAFAVVQCIFAACVCVWQPAANSTNAICPFGASAMGPFVMVSSLRCAPPA